MKDHPSITCAVGAALFLVCPAWSQILPGTPRQFLVAEGDPFSHSIGHVVCGEFSGDRRGDAALVVDGRLRIVLGAAGFGAQIGVTTPGDGTVVDCVAVADSEPFRDLVVFVVAGGTSPGLYGLSVSASGTADLFALDAPQWSAVLALVRSPSDPGGILGLTEDGTVVKRGVVADRSFDSMPDIPLPIPAESFRVAGWNSAGDLRLFLWKLDTIYVARLDGSIEESSAAVNPVNDWDAGYSATLGHGRIVRVSQDVFETTWFEVVDPGGIVAQCEPISDVRPRVLLADLFHRGDIDFLGVSTRTAQGFATLAGIGTVPGGYLVNGWGTVHFGFDSPQYSGCTHFSNLAVADLDLDGDGDLVFSDEAMNTIHVQPNWSADEIAASPELFSYQADFTDAGPGFQKFNFTLLPRSYPGFQPTHVEINMYQRLDVNGSPVHQLLGSFVVPATPSQVLAGGYETGSIGVAAEYTGPDCTDADFVVVLRFLHADAGAASYDAFGVDSYTGFHHNRIADPNSQGGYKDGDPGGTNPLPDVIGSGIVPPGRSPPPPPPPGG